MKLVLINNKSNFGNNLRKLPTKLIYIVKLYLYINPFVSLIYIRSFYIVDINEFIGTIKIHLSFYRIFCGFSKISQIMIHSTFILL